MTATYIVTTHHASYPPNCGTFTLRVATNRDGTRYVSGSPFGCSRDYKASTDREAIKLLLAEHATSLVSCKQA